MSPPAANQNDDNRSPDDLSLEDFRRLGVRPFECRQTVIRLGALRSTRTLAKQQLSAPSEQGTRQLSKVIASAYRLLDPRRRDDPMQRALVGRIMPQAVSVAGQTRFLDGGKNADDGIMPIDVLGSQDQHDHFLFSETEPPPAWTISLNENDLIHRSSTMRKGTRAKVRKKTGRSPYMWAGLVVGGLIFGAILGLASVGERAWSVGDVPRPVEQPLDDSMEQDNSSSSNTANSDDFNNQPDAIDQFGSLATQSEHTELESPIGTLPDSDSLEALPNLEPVEQTPPPIVVAPTVEIARPTDVVRPISEPEMQQPVDLPIEPQVQASESNESFALPDDVSIRAARRSMTSQVPDLTESIDIATITDRVDQVRQYRDGQTVGSAEHWTATIAIIEHQWLVDRADQVIGQIAELSKTYAIRLPTEASASFIAACNIARLPETQSRLFEQGILLADYLLVNESPNECRRVIETLSQIGQNPELEQGHERLQQFSNSIEQMERLFSATERWVAQDDKTELTKDAGIAGRYYCLMLRRWEVGLPWLVAVSDTRIARVAQQDLEATDAPSRISAAERWIEIADRYQGRRADSMRLRGIELMRESLDEATAIRRLEAERKIEETEKLLPADLRNRRSGS